MGLKVCCFVGFCHHLQNAMSPHTYAYHFESKTKTMIMITDNFLTTMINVCITGCGSR